MFGPSGEQGGSAKSLRVLLGTLAAVVVFTFGYTLGGSANISSNGAWTGGSIFDSLDEGPQADMTKFWEVWNVVAEGYVDQPVDEHAMLEGAIEGLVWALGDPYTSYFTKEDAEAFAADLEGTFSGIGAEIAERDVGITVIAPLADTPAERAGLLPGDIIAAIDEESTAGFTVEEAVQRIRGEAGTTVVLTLIRGEEAFEVSIVREEIHTKSVTWEVREDGIAVVTISMFNEETVGLFAEAAEEIMDRGAEGIVVDLRNNPGGLLVAAVDVAAFWTGDQTVVIEAFQDGQEAYRGEGTPVLAGIPTVVLVNGGSASGSEILAGALQDHGLATIMGEQTFGKGSVQNYVELDDGSAVKVTVARWLTPAGRTIHDVGITPDEVVTETLEEIHAGETPQMDAAIRHLSQE